jgi:hypothetical protein
LTRKGRSAQQQREEKIMAMIQCAQGHYYNQAQYSSCPFCGVPDLGIDPTVPKRPEGAAGNEGGRTVPRGRAADGIDDGKTVGIGQKQMGIDPTVGWLVCIKGPERGRDYRIRSGRNFIGRAQRMHICIDGDPMISRDKHAIISYDPKYSRFTLLPGDGSGLTYLNENAVDVPVELKAHDTVELGETRLMFVPLCGENFTWQADTPTGGSSQ